MTVVLNLQNVPDLPLRTLIPVFPVFWPFRGRCRRCSSLRERRKLPQQSRARPIMPLPSTRARAPADHRTDRLTGVAPGSLAAKRRQTQANGFVRTFGSPLPCRVASIAIPGSECPAVAILAVHELIQLRQVRADEFFGVPLNPLTFRCPNGEIPRQDRFRQATSVTEV